MDEIMFSKPWRCDGEYRLATYWVNKDGCTCDHFSDGDHTDCDESDLPSARELDAAWRDYYAYVQRTGEDPLNQFPVRRDEADEDTWEIVLGQSRGDVVFRQARRATVVHSDGATLWERTVRKDPDLLPAYLRKFLMLGEGRKLGIPESLASLASVHGVKWQPGARLTIVEKLPHRVPRPAADVEAELRELARCALVRLDKSRAAS